MSSPKNSPFSVAAKASRASLALCLGFVCVFGAYLIADRISPYDRNGQGVLTGLLPRATLVVVWAGAALTALFGIASLLFIRKPDIATNAVYGIAGRGVFGVIMGLLGTLILWLFVGHAVIGF